MYGFERFNVDRDLKPKEYKIYKIVVNENNPILYLYKLLSEVLTGQNHQSRRSSRESNVERLMLN